MCIRVSGSRPRMIGALRTARTVRMTGKWTMRILPPVISLTTTTQLRTRTGHSMTPDIGESINLTPDLVYLDFEFQCDFPPHVLWGSFFHHPSGERVTIDFRKEGSIAYLRQLQFRWQDAIWAAYAAHAEMVCFLALGLDITEMRWLDLFCEARQITGSHSHFYSRKGGLLYALDALGVPHKGNTAHKEAMRLLILEGDPAAFTADQERAIVEYNQEDTDVLAPLLAAIRQVHALARKDYKLSAAVKRADYLKALAYFDFRTKGFPVDVDKVNLIYGNIKLVRRIIAEECNAKYGGKVFRYNKRTDDYSMSFTGLVEHVDSLPFPTDWALTPSGRLRTDADYLDDFVRANPYFEHQRDTLALLSQLKNNDIRQLVKGGGGRGGGGPGGTSTGRNQ